VVDSDSGVIVTCRPTVFTTPLPFNTIHHTVNVRPTLDMRMQCILI